MVELLKTLSTFGSTNGGSWVMSYEEKHARADLGYPAMALCTLLVKTKSSHIASVFIPFLMAKF